MTWTETETDVHVGAMMGSIPTISMIVTALFAFRVQFSPTFESAAQNFCAGLILGAVAKELFPLLGSVSQGNSFFSVTVGFFFGLFFIHFLDFAVDSVEHFFSNLQSKSELSESVHMSSSRSYQSMESNENERLTENSGDSGSDHDVPIMLLASQAIASPMHRERIRKKVSELFACISSMEQKSNFLSINISSKNDKNAQNPEIEVVADQIDEDIHRMQYNLDHCRRLIQGSGSNIEAVVPRIWITEKGKNALCLRLEELKEGALGLSDALRQDNLSRELIEEIHEIIDNMDEQINLLHDTVEDYSFKWGRRGKRNQIPFPESGSTIPLSLMIPVTVDCIVDGFLVGVTSSISARAGLILALANFMEMGFLGLAVSVRVRKCTASSLFYRYCALVIPPLIMLTASVLGALCGSAMREHPSLFSGFISFGIVALLYLVVNELLVEARELQGAESWWNAMVLFCGIYAVLLLDSLPTDPNSYH